MVLGPEAKVMHILELKVTNSIFNTVICQIPYEMRYIMFLSSLLFSTGLSGQENWQALFEKDLSNALDERGVWFFDGDVLTSSKDACIFTQVEYENFIIDLEFKNEEGSNSGVIVYCTDRTNWIPNSVEIQIADDYYFKDKDWVPNFMCGGIFGHLAPRSTLVKRAGEWNHMNIRCEGQRITVQLNGELSADMDMSLWTSGSRNPDGSDIPSWLPKPFSELPTKGFIGLQGKHGKANIYFRNLRMARIE